jgi:predicted negative regulator of RcsB-dependent stress response
MKKIVDSSIDSHKVVETNPLPESKSIIKTNSNSNWIILIVIIIIGVVGFMIYNHVQNSKQKAI